MSAMSAAVWERLTREKRPQSRESIIRGIRTANGDLMHVLGVARVEFP